MKKDVIKTRLQLHTSLKNAAQSQEGAAYETFGGAFRSILKQEGAGRFYRGMISPILAEAPKRAIKFGTNEKYKSIAKTFTKDGKLTSIHHVLTGAFAGMTEAFVNCPFEVVKVRMQAKENVKLYNNSMSALIGTVSKEGIFALYKGLEAQLWRNGIWNGAYFGLIGLIREKIPKPASKSGEQFHSFVCGFLGGTAATTLNTPFDVVKSRMQNVSTKGVSKWTLPSLGQVYKQEGFKACYKGYSARIIRLGPGGGIMLVAFDVVVDLLK